MTLYINIKYEYIMQRYFDDDYSLIQKGLQRPELPLKKLNLW